MICIGVVICVLYTISPVCLCNLCLCKCACVFDVCLMRTCVHVPVCMHAYIHKYIPLWHMQRHEHMISPLSKLHVRCVQSANRACRNGSKRTGPIALMQIGLSDQLFLFASGHRDTGTSGPRTGGNMKIKKHHKLA